MAFISRRNFLVGASTSFVALASGGQEYLDLQNSMQGFLHGVASGDPTSTSVIIWTRLTTDRPTSVYWEISLNQGFTEVIKRGARSAIPDSDYTVKIDVEGLVSNQTYYYRFSAGSYSSDIGITKTLPVGKLEQLTLAVVSCSNYPFGYFNVYEHIARDNTVDFVLHLGDYLYEYGQDGWGGATGVLLNRRHQPAGETITLADYRIRHAQYKSDPASRLMHAAHPLIPIWDDHESANNPYQYGAQNHQQEEGDWQRRKTASIQAYFEWMPIREPAKGADKAHLWRHFQFGDLASLITLETRHTARSKQLSYGKNNGGVNNMETRSRFIEQHINDPSRTLLHPEMTEFLSARLSDSVNTGQPWRIIGNQIPMARIAMPDFRNAINICDPQYSDKTKRRLATNQLRGQWHLPLSLDTWSGYGAAREAFYHHCKDVGACDLLVFTGDSHCFWLNELSNQDKKPMGIEIGTTSVTSPGSFEYFGTQMSKFESLLAAQNPEVLWASCQHRGYVKACLTDQQANIDYIAMNTITSQSVESFVQKSIAISRQDGRLILTEI